MLSKIIAKSSTTAMFVTLALTVAVTTVTPSTLAQVEITEGENFTAPENVTAPENMTEIGNLTGDDAGLPPIPEGFAP